jgi:hypothetical protein
VAVGAGRCLEHFDDLRSLLVSPRRQADLASS